jgi:hypothetical protein
MSLASTPKWTPKDHELFTSVLKALAKYWNVTVKGVDSDLSRLYLDKWEWEDKSKAFFMPDKQLDYVCHTKNDAAEVRLCGTLQAMGAQ